MINMVYILLKYMKIKEICIKTYVISEYSMYDTWGTDITGTDITGKKYKISFFKKSVLPISFIFSDIYKVAMFNIRYNYGKIWFICF